LLIELAAVLADRGHIGLQLFLQLGRLLLLLAHGLELLLALLDGLGRGGRGRLLLRRRGLRDRRSERHRDKAGGQQRDRKRHRECPRPAAANGAGLQVSVPR
jgi:hypothetical protein